MGGVTDQPESTGGARGLEMSEFYSVYPSVSLTSLGQHSTIFLNYNFVAERFQMDPHITTTSHAFTGRIEAQPSNTTHFRLSNTLNTAPDYSTINVLKGIAPMEGGFQYIYEPQLYKRSNISNSSNIGLDIDLTDKSFLTFSASGSFRNYEEEEERTSQSDQTRVEGNVGFSHKQSKRLTWSLKYKVWQNDYDNLYETTRSHSATFGISHELSPGWNLNLEAGPSFAEKTDDLNYLINANISKQFQTNHFSVGYSHSASDSTGVGGTTESHHINLTFFQSLGRTTSLNFQASAFKQSPYDYEGLYGSLALSQQLGRHWIASIGASYRAYDLYTSKRFYASIGFRIGEIRAIRG